MRNAASCLTRIHILRRCYLSLLLSPPPHPSSSSSSSSTLQARATPTRCRISVSWMQWRKRLWCSPWAHTCTRLQRRRKVKEHYDIIRYKSCDLVTDILSKPCPHTIYILSDICVLQRLLTGLCDLKKSHKLSTTNLLSTTGLPCWTNWTVPWSYF
jgi:hypothetical protein